MTLYLLCIMHIKPNKWHKNKWKYNCKPSHTSIINNNIHFQKNEDQIKFKNRPKVSPFVRW